LFSATQESLHRADRNRVRITGQVWDVVSDFQAIANSLGLLPTRLQELVPVSRSHFLIGASDACQLGMGGVWFDLLGGNPPLP
jgi:hypothetical protein